ncbi:hypothetical protein B0H11DRAFT_2077058 [Mycena galericulata]|nr:hypothetical protein B0H11DRAFT_2077058 [Mycena galericulata]
MKKFKETQGTAFMLPSQILGLIFCQMQPLRSPAYSCSRNEKYRVLMVFCMCGLAFQMRLFVLSTARRGSM